MIERSRTRPRPVAADGNASGPRRRPESSGSSVDARNESVTIDGFPITVGRSLSKRARSKTRSCRDAGHRRPLVPEPIQRPATRSCGGRRTRRSTYARKLKRGDLLDDKLTGTGEARKSVGGVSLQYGHDAFTGRYAFNAIIAPDRSAGGYDWSDQRDATFVVTNERQDRLAGGNLHRSCSGGTAGNNRDPGREQRELRNRHDGDRPVPRPDFIPAGMTINGIPDATHVDPRATCSTRTVRGVVLHDRASAERDANGRDYKRPEPDGRSARTDEGGQRSADIAVEHGHTTSPASTTTGRSSLGPVGRHDRGLEDPRRFIRARRRWSRRFADTGLFRSRRSSRRSARR